MSKENKNWWTLEQQQQQQQQKTKTIILYSQFVEIIMITYSIY